MVKPGSIILSAIQSGRRSLWQILRVWPYSIQELSEALERLQAEGWVEKAGDGWSRICLTDRGQQVAELLLVVETGCSACQGQSVEAPEVWMRRFRKLIENRPLPLAEYDQGFMRAEDAMARVAFTHRMGDLAGRDILVVGDDDLISLALAVTGLANRIAVIEVDERLQQFIEHAGRRQNLSIDFCRLDLRCPLPADLVGRFDTFITDPVETLPGFELFLSRAARGLRGRRAAGYFGLTTLEASLPKWRRLESLILEMNLVVTDIIRDFSLYPEKENQWEHFYSSYDMMSLFGIKDSLPNSDWYRSSLVRVEAIGELRPTIEGAVDFTQRELYFDEESLASPHVPK